MKSEHAGHRKRLRERFLKGGEKAFPDYELLELLLCGVLPRGDVKPLAKKLLSECGSLSGVLQADIEKLKSIPGLGESSFIALKVIHEVACRLVREETSAQPIMQSWQGVIDYCRARMSHLTVEQFRLLFLDQKNKLIADEVQQQGTVDRTPIFPREVVKRSLELGAVSLIMVHNHPSGDPTPSAADIDITRKVIKAAKELDIEVLDHLIIGRCGHTSLREKRLI
ncbi:MAG: DNA repair protein RadC [Alphaproteobacteria bacterium]|nr:DNA repair protein RadC [Alphaproteobacteria bacterium]